MRYSIFCCLFLGISLCLGFSSCRLDSFLFNPTQITEYKLDDYDGPQLFVTDSTYDIAPNLVNLTTIQAGSGEDQVTLHAVYIGDMSRINQDTVILYCHGNAGNLDTYWERAKILANAGGKNRFGVLMMDYRGYGLSEGTSTEATLYSDVDDCMKWLKDRGLTDDRLILYGFSLGSAPTAKLTATPRTMTASKIVMEAPFASFDFIAQEVAKLSVTGSLYADLQINNAEEIKQIQQPFLWIHGEDDAFTDIKHGELVSQNYQGTHKVERRVPGAGHSDVPLFMGIDTYRDLIANFITGAI